MPELYCASVPEKLRIVLLSVKSMSFKHDLGGSVIMTQTAYAYVPCACTIVSDLNLVKKNVDTAEFMASSNF